MANSSSPPLSLPNIVPPPLATTLPPPSSSSPTQSPPNATPSNSSNPSSSPPLQSPPSSTAPPTVSLSPLPPVSSSAPPTSSPPSRPPPSPLLSPPPVSASPPLTLSPPPVPASPPPPTLSTTPAAASPSPSSPPPPTPQAVSPSPPVVSPPPPIRSPPKHANSQPPPSASLPETSPPPPILPSPSPSGSNQAPPPSPNAIPIASPPPSRDQTSPMASPPPSNSSTAGTASTPPLSSPLTPGPTGNVSAPIVPSSTKSLNNSNVNVVVGNEISRSGRMKAGTSVAIGLVVCVLFLSFIGIAVWYVRKKKKKAVGYGGGCVIPAPMGSSHMSDFPYSKSPSSAPLVGNGSHRSGFVYSTPEPSGLGNSRSWFTYEELLHVTNGFSEQNLLGEGGFGPVYKGCLPDGREVAVKQLKVGGGQGEREFRAEVEIISRVHHRHLVSLVGYCISDHHRLLVYEYVPNNTLYYHLHGQGRPVMDWATRVKVADGAARGIAYLHEDCHPRIIHRDIKSSNILLDNNFESQVSDFGLAKLALDSITHLNFSFASRAMSSSAIASCQRMQARPLMSHALDAQDFDGLVDPRLENNYIESEMFRMIEAAASCVRHSAVKRPRMSQVVRALDCIDDSADLTNGMRPGQSELFNSAQQSAEIRLFQRLAFGNQDYSINFSQTSWPAERDF
ncbi:hypothetical protein MRB53_031477 [Persea americana]|uniref:Uncharacterized protein n=1 Tax=Persea americana TaxID=3435 RepID=A0ACC2KPR1_PERAE|nr:hypothetical protein MRB53_031477 [Persea americana]